MVPVPGAQVNSNQFLSPSNDYVEELTYKGPYLIHSMSTFQVLSCTESQGAIS